MNKISIMGRIVKDIELKVANSGAEYINLSVAVDRYMGKDKERETDFFDCMIGGKTAAMVHQYFRKGDGIILHGSMQSRKYQDKDGNNRTGWSMNVREVEFPLGKGKGGTESATTAPSYVEMPNDGELPF